MNDEIFTLWVIYDHPEDYPEHWVVRPQNIRKGGGKSYGMPTLHSSLEEARATLPEGAYNIGRMPEDVPAIKEVWM